MRQLSEKQKVWALSLREAGVSQKDVALRLGVSVRTIRRLGMKPGEVPFASKEAGVWKEEVLWEQENFCPGP